MPLWRINQRDVHQMTTLSNKRKSVRLTPTFEELRACRGTWGVVQSRIHGVQSLVRGVLECVVVAPVRVPLEMTPR